MKVYTVGGAVRDELLGLPVADRDFVVVGATPEEMAARGFMPVGGDFPVFLHPQTREEYALARTERKSGRGYGGFVFHASPEVSLEDDLRRRDLTINAMAKDADGELIDPYGGARDLQEGVLRHVSEAFAEDPVRILRTARFAARFADFATAEETRELLRRMVAEGEADHLTTERVWRELSRGLTERKPSRMIEALRECGALEKVLPEVAALRGVPERLDYHPEGESYLHTLMVIDAAADMDLSGPERFAALLHDIGKAGTPAEILPSHHGHEGRSAELVEVACRRLQPPRKWADLARIAAREHGRIHSALEMRAATLADLFSALDAYRRPERLESVLRVCQADFYFLPERLNKPYPQGIRVRAAFAAAMKVDAGAIARETEREKVAEKIRAARIEAIRESEKQPPRKRV